MICLELFLTFLKIGAFTFGGGYAMIPLIRDEVLSHGWMTDERIMDLIAVSESTPGPIAINMATFIGSSQGGFAGAVCATLGVVLPSFVIILIITALVANLMKFAGVQAFLSGVRPVVVGLICATSVTMFLSVILSVSHFTDAISVDVRGVIILAALIAIHFIYKKIKGKRPSPILMILISAVMGIAAYSL
ncbi:MAG: chromate transporter [Clostridia bacterium]|nr:chromate transporter [Clostridia bacterium]